MKPLFDFAGQNWLITPAALAVGEHPPASIHDQTFLLVLTGVVLANLEGTSSAQWLHETLSFMPDMAGPNNTGGSGPLPWAINRFGIPQPQGQSFTIGFSLEEWAPFASLSSIFNQGHSVNSGFAVDVWRPNHFATGTDAFTHAPVQNIFTGLNVDVAVRDSDAWLYRLGYNITLLGKIVFLTAPKTLFRSDFNQTADGDPPATQQAIGTARVEGPPRSVIVVEPSFSQADKWLQVSRPNGPDIASFVGVLTEVEGDGSYTFFTLLFMPSGSQVASISFETPSQEFLHFDFMPNNTVRIDDNPATEFGSFPRDQIFVFRVRLDIAAAQTTAQVTLSGGASGSRSYTVPPQTQPLSRQFGAIRVWQGFPHTGRFFATDIFVQWES